ncbi:polysaccharide deacetylase family protein [Thalassotalea ponticola]|uniref:polysaccharide deacetylase family protein n=1 Tax=Thalassotalea ponticola TaxID=1523392 RepID=UPI0025B3BD5C|nr:polysaccharide deacetylase family protein [Thalassotalea ponticola]MDN3652292.1 polysaccharide deacetylase family protein [Thalassotalea ponticola]
MKKLVILLLVTLLLGLKPSFAAVILVYHHVSEHTPKSTSVTPQQFAKHLQFIKDNGYNVVALNRVIERLKQGLPLADKTVVITFDDGYSDILANGHPLLKQYGFPYTVFINPSTVPEEPGAYLTWSQIQQMSNDGVLIANHGLTHDSLIKTPAGYSQAGWLDKQLTALEQAEQIIADKTGQNWRYFALPYGEYSLQAQQKLQQLGFVVFTQQSGAVGLSTDLTAIPRFPASVPYHQLTTLKDKLASLPFDLDRQTQRDETVVPHAVDAKTKVTLNSADFDKRQLNCFVAGHGKAEIQWQDERSFIVSVDGGFKAGRNRANCTAPSNSKPGRYYWYSKPWFVPHQDGRWYKN